MYYLIDPKCVKSLFLPYIGLSPGGLAGPVQAAFRPITVPGRFEGGTLGMGGPPITPGGPRLPTEDLMDFKTVMAAKSSWNLSSLLSGQYRIV